MSVFQTNMVSGNQSPDSLIKQKYREYKMLVKNVDNNKGVLRMTRKNGFTLIEIVLVIAIIGIVAGLLSPTLRNIHEKKNILRCVNNVKNITQGFMIYAANENHGRLPLCGWYVHGSNNPFGLPRGNHGVGKPWMDMVLPYVNYDKNFFICPSDDDTTDFNFHVHGPSWVSDSWFDYPPEERTQFTECSYSANEDIVGIDNRWNTYNAGGGGDTAAYAGRIGGDLTRLQRSPSATALISDGNHLWINSQRIRSMQDSEEIEQDYTMDRAVFNHIDGITVGYCDGHTEWIKQGRFSTLNLDPNALGN